MNAPATQSFDQPTPTPISEKKLAANRANAQKSTGPRTTDGKSRSAQNSLRHGGYAQDTLLPSDNPKEFQQFRTDWLKSLSPQTTPELYLTDRAVSLAWRLQRIVRADTTLHLNTQSLFKDHAANLRNNPKDLHDLKNLPYFKSLTDKSTPLPTLSPAAALADATDSDAPNPFDQLNKTEDRLQSMLHRALKQLQQLQKQRTENPPPPCPFLLEEEIPQNEPTNDTDITNNKSDEGNSRNEPTDDLAHTKVTDQNNPRNEPTDPQTQDALIENSPTPPFADGGARL